MSEINHTLINKLLSLALNHATAPGEIDNAGRMLISHLRKAGARADDFVRGGATKVVVQERIVYRDRPVEKIVYRDRPVEKVVYRDRPSSAPPPPEIAMPFGKHKGVPITEINPGYLQWVLDNCDRIDAYLVAEIRRVLKLDQD